MADSIKNFRDDDFLYRERGACALESAEVAERSAEIAGGKR
jgi:hypothetical protein